MTDVDVDVVIVGSGPVGAAYARILGERSGARILMIERGDALSRPPGANLKNFLADGVWRASTDTDVAQVSASSLARTGTALWTARVGGSDLPGAATSTNVGGMGAHWSCATPRPAPDEQGDVLAPEDWDGPLAAASRLLAASPQAFSGSRRGAQMIARLDARFRDRLERPVGVMPHACRRDEQDRLRWTGADTVLGEIAESPRFSLRSDTLCRRLLLNDSGTQVRGVEVEVVGTGEVARVTARHVVVAADSLRTPQLLWASGIRPAALGRYLNEHPMIAATVLLDDELMAAAKGNEPDRRAAVWVPFSSTHRFSGQIENSPGSPAGFEIDALRGVPRSRIVSLTWFCPKEPRAEDRLVFLDEADADGLPRVHIEYGLSAHDRAVVAEGIELTRQAGEAIGTFVTGQEPAQLPDGISLHYMGTMRMGRSNDGTSVCDSMSRVWEVDGLVVGGNGVIPTATAANPTLTSVALAVRGAEQLIRELA
jgi:choline dehydrogenase-like flavoprotein